MAIQNHEKHTGIQRPYPDQIYVDVVLPVYSGEHMHV